MQKITIIDTGGTFNKYYDPISGELKVDTQAEAIKTICRKWHFEQVEIKPMIGKDSLEIDMIDRIELLQAILALENEKILIIHGTDTIDQTATYLDEAEIDKSIVLTGAMIPYSIDATEASANSALAIGFLRSNPKNGVYIAMHGIVAPHKKVIKDRRRGKFIYID